MGPRGHCLHTEGTGNPPVRWEAGHRQPDIEARHSGGHWGTANCTNRALPRGQIGAHWVQRVRQPVRQEAPSGALSTVHSGGTDNHSDKGHTVGHCQPYTPMAQPGTPLGHSLFYIHNTEGTGNKPGRGSWEQRAQTTRQTEERRRGKRRDRGPTALQFLNKV